MKKLFSALLVLVFATSFAPMNVELAHAAVQQAAITRSQAEQRALNMINLSWTYDSSKNGIINSNYASSVAPPKQFAAVTTAQETGIPYAWGGFDSIDTNSYNAPWTSFLDAVNKGAYAGNVDSSGGIGYVSGTAGLDCSGFIQAVFNIKDYKQSTTTLLNNYFTKINLTDIKHMDILDKPGDHAVIFDKWGTQNGIQGAFTYEATPDQTYGGIQGTKHYFISMNTINSGYIPARYNFIVDDTSTQTSTSSNTTAASSSTTTAPSSTTGTAQTDTSSTAAASSSDTAATSAATTTTTSSTDTASTSTSTGTTAATPTTSSSGITASTTTTSTQATQPEPVNVNSYAQIANVNSYANFRTAPSAGAGILGTIPLGTIIYVTDYSSGWYKLSYNGQTGWVYGHLLAAVPSGKYVQLNGAYQLNIRSSASSNAAIVGQLKQGQYAQVLGYNSTKSWYNISINGLTGWSYGAYLKFIQ